MRDLRRKLQRGAIQVTMPLTLSDDKLNEATCCEAVRVEPAHISVPPGISVEMAENESVIHVTLHRLMERILPVRLENTGEGKVSQLKVEPQTVLVKGPQAVLERAEAISTQPYALSNPPEGAADALVSGT